MKSTKKFVKASFAIVILFLVTFYGVSNVAAQNTSEHDRWQYEFTIYGWFSSIDGTLKYNVPPGSGGNITVDTSDILD